ncbi:MAG: hypothetical protein IK077_08545, partial [Thermoguttaceae bacterium]|nr:hypothetical protein [Thermoguttaceae bacterium]
AGRDAVGFTERPTGATVQFRAGARTGSPPSDAALRAERDAVGFTERPTGATVQFRAGARTGSPPSDAALRAGLGAS